MASRQRKRRTDVTTIQLDKSTRLQLDRLGDIHRESYNDIILRLIKFYQQERVGITLPKSILQRIVEVRENVRVVNEIASGQVKPVLVLTR